MTLRDHLRPSAIVDASALGATARSAAEGLSRAAISGVSRVGSHIGVDPDVVPGPRGGLPPEELTAAHWGNGSRRVIDPIGWFEHQKGIDELQKSFDAIPS